MRKTKRNKNQKRHIYFCNTIFDRGRIIFLFEHFLLVTRNAIFSIIIRTRNKNEYKNQVHNNGTFNSKFYFKCNNN